MSSAATALERLRASRTSGSAPRRIVIIAAHPDDEVIGVGARLCCWRDAHVVCVTDGAPRDMRDVLAANVRTCAEYAVLRRAERSRALAIAGFDLSHVYELGFRDQDTSRELVSLTGAVTALLRALRPDVIVTHPYEGGHPDHDSTAFAVRASVRLFARDAGAAVPIVEMTSYHAGPHGICTGCFLPASDSAVDDEPLTPALRERKRAMLACFASQRSTLQYFDCVAEPLRVAPAYRFGTPPHDGTLFYENFDWGISGHDWRAEARSAARSLGLERQLL